MINALYLIILKPIILLLEFLFHYFFIAGKMDVIETIGIISFLISTLCLPFYIKAEKIQSEEKAIQNKMADRVNSIKKNFKGDEQYFMLQTCYRQNNYHPVMSLRLSLSLLLQIPFFLSAYIFFSNLPALNNSYFWFIENLAKPDNLLFIGSFPINILPIIMTLINLASGYIYTGSLSFNKNKVQIITSLVFLLLLYNSPSGLILFWTFNNLYALFKNIFLKFKTEKDLYMTICAILSNGYLFYLYFHSFKLNIVYFISLALLLCLFFKVPEKLQKLKLNFPYIKLFFISAFFLWILLGILIPTNVFSSSPTEFFFTDKATSYKILTETALIFFGVFIFWGSCVFYIFSKESKKHFSLFLCILGIAALMNLHFWQMPQIPLLNDLTFNASPRFIVFTSASIFRYIGYYIVLLLVLLFIGYSIKKKYALLQNFMVITIISMLIFAGCNTYKIITIYDKYVKAPQNYNTKEKLINLSRTKKNVVFLFLDSTISSFFPMLLEEHPELKETYRGFDYYPNTISFAEYSILGYLPMFGGYEYTPQHIDERKIDFLTKHNEAVTLLARFFKQNGFDATIIHPMNNAWWDGLSQNGNNKPIQYNDLYEKYSIKTFIPPKFQSINHKKNEAESIEITKRNMVYFSLMSIFPENCKKFLYNRGKYHSLRRDRNTIYKQDTIQAYMELAKLIDITDFSSENNTYTNFNNWLVHYPNIFSLPNYELDELNPPDGFLANLHPQLNSMSVKHYHATAASLILVGKWLDYLKQEGVYDNTRIIIVADHGHYLHNNSESAFFNLRIFPINPILLVKDFNSRHELKMDNYELMTNADAPFFALKGIVNEMKNPFTGKIMTQEDKRKGLYVKLRGSRLPKDYLDRNEVINDKDMYMFLKGGKAPREEENWDTDISAQELKDNIYKNY